MIDKTLRKILFSTYVFLMAIPCLAAPRALLVGVAEYPRSPLDSPPRDIRLIGESLKERGWQITLLENPTSVALRRAVSSLAMASKSDNYPVLLYFSGHGMQSRGENFLLPTDITGSLPDAIRKSLSLSEVFRSFSGHSAPKIVIVDACRNDPLGTASVAVSVGLNSQYAPSNTLIAYATSPGAYALDGNAGNGSPYALSLAAALKQHDSFDEVFREVRRGTLKRTNGRQLPWESSSLVETVSLVNKSKLPTPGRTATTPRPSDRPPTPVSTAQIAEKISDVADPIAQAVAYLVSLAEAAPNDAFWQWNGEPELRLRGDIVKSLRAVNSRAPRFAIQGLATALQEGRFFSACKKGSGIDVDCGDFDRAFIFEPNLELALKLSEVGSTKKINTELLANHYKNGWLVDRNILTAYDFYLEDTKLGGEYAAVNVNKMVQEVLVENGASIKVDGDFGPASCAALKKLIGDTTCRATVSRDQVRNLIVALQ